MLAGVARGPRPCTPRPAGRMYGGTCGMTFESRGIIRRRFLFTASSLKRTCVGGETSARSACITH